LGMKSGVTCRADYYVQHYMHIDMHMGMALAWAWARNSVLCCAVLYLYVAI